MLLFVGVEIGWCDKLKNIIFTSPVIELSNIKLLLLLVYQTSKSLIIMCAVKETPLCRINNLILQI